MFENLLFILCTITNFDSYIIVIFRSLTFWCQAFKFIENENPVCLPKPGSSMVRSEFFGHHRPDRTNNFYLQGEAVTCFCL